MASSSSEQNPFSIKSKSRSVILRRILTNITRATLRTFFAYAFIIFLVSVELSSFDFIGVGGGSVYRPNTLEYRFSSPIRRDIILAPHTSYTEVSPTAVGRGGVDLLSALGTHFVGYEEAHASVTKNPRFNWIQFLSRLPRVKVPSAKARPYIQKHINKFFRSGVNIPSAELLYCTLPDKYKCEVNVTTFKVWHMIFQLKQNLLKSIFVDGTVKCYIDGQPSQHEGFVTVSDNPYKIVDRLTFSKANFNLSKNWTNEKI